MPQMLYCAENLSSFDIILSFFFIIQCDRPLVYMEFLTILSVQNYLFCHSDYLFLSPFTSIEWYPG